MRRLPAKVLSDLRRPTDKLPRISLQTSEEIRTRRDFAAGRTAADKSSAGIKEDARRRTSADSSRRQSPVAARREKFNAGKRRDDCRPDFVKKMGKSDVVFVGIARLSANSFSIFRQKDGFRAKLKAERIRVQPANLSIFCRSSFAEFEILDLFAPRTGVTSF